MIGGFKRHGGAIPQHFIHGGLNSLGRGFWIELDQRGAQAAGQHSFALGFTAERACCAKAFIQCRHRFPAKRCKQPDGGLFDELVFGEGVRHSTKQSDRKNTIKIRIQFRARKVILFLESQNNVCKFFRFICQLM